MSQRGFRFAGQNGGLPEVDSGLDYAANFSSIARVAYASSGVLRPKIEWGR